MRKLELQALLHVRQGRPVRRELLGDSAKDALTWMESYLLKERDWPSLDLLCERYELTLPERMDAYDEVLQLLTSRHVESAADQLLEKADTLGDPLERAAFLRDGLGDVLAAVDATPDLALMSDYEARYRQYLEDVRAGQTAKVCDFGFPTLDAELNGFEKKDLVVLVARYSAGKSTLARKIALNARLQGKKVTYLALEEPADITLRMLDAMLAGVSPRDYLQRRLDLPDLQKIQQAGTAHAGKGEIQVIDQLPSRNVSALLGVLHETKPDLLIIDQLTHLVASHDWKDFTDATRRVKAVAMTSGVPILLLSQANRKGDVAYADSVGQDADKLLKLSEDAKDVHQAKTITVEKNRRGKRFFDVELDWDPGIGKVTERQLTGPYTAVPGASPVKVDDSWDAFGD